MVIVFAQIVGGKRTVMKLDDQDEIKGQNLSRKKKRGEKRSHN